MQFNQSDIAVIGIACRFPGAKNYQEFWNNLENGVNSIVEIPFERWDVNRYYSTNPEPGKSISKWAGLLDDIDQFDAAFFGISPREAQRMDPQQRIMLELTWSCIEDAGYAPSQLSGHAVGVFTGVCNYDYDALQNRIKENVDGHAGTGSWVCMIPNRISSFFNFRGPSIPVDTACSSSLVALHQAIYSLENQECRMALVGGVTVLCDPARYIQMSQLGMLSPTGLCKTFDEHADGYVRGEGAGVILVKPLSQAVEDNDYIYGVIKGSAINHGGRVRTLTSPNAYAQSQVLYDAYRRANILPHHIAYIEAHGTGTPLGDPLEISGLKRAFRKLYQKYALPAIEQHCGLGTVKTNIGHLEAAAGIAGVIKVLLALQNQKIPKIVNFQKLNPRIDLKHSSFYIVCKTQPWAQSQDLSGELIPRCAGISSFGVGGVNAHIVVEEAQKLPTSQVSIKRPFHIMTLSARSEKSLRELAETYQKFLNRTPDVSLADICFTASVGRDHFKHRLSSVSHSKLELEEHLDSFLNGCKVNGLVQKQNNNGSLGPPKIAFLFTGQGSQYPEMGRTLYETQPTFKQEIDNCSAILDAYLEQSLVETLYPKEKHESLLKHESHLKRYMLPALFAVEYALYQLWCSWGIEPDVLMGQGVGEYVAACVAGVFSLADGLKLVASYGLFLQQLSKGESMKSMLAEFQQVAQQVEYCSPQRPLVSTVLGAVDQEVMTTANYWCKQISSPASIVASIEAVHQEGCGVFIECGPEPVLLELGRQSVPEGVGLWLPSLRSGHSDWQQMLTSLGELYEWGFSVDWEGFERDYPQRRRVPLPTYSFQRRRYWVESPSEPPKRGTASTDIVELLSSGNTQALTGKVSETAQFTYDQLLMINKALNILVCQHQHQLEDESF